MATTTLEKPLSASSNFIANSPCPYGWGIRFLNWMKLLSADDPVTCELFDGFSDDIRQLHKKLMWKIIKDNDFPHFVAEYWLRDDDHFNTTKFVIKVGGYKMTSNCINDTMVEYIPSSPFNIEQVVIDDIINTAMTVHG